MRVLIVDDDVMKATTISNILVEAGVPSKDDIAHVTNAYDAAIELRKTQFDLLVLDLMIPKARLAQPEIDGGQALLRDIMARAAYLRPRYIVGLTSYDDARDKSEADFNNGLWSILKYDTKSPDWIDQLTNKVRYIKSSAEAASIGQDYDFDVAFVCALARPELEAVLELDCGWRESARPADPTRYWVGSLTVDGKTLNVGFHAELSRLGA